MHLPDYLNYQAKSLISTIEIVLGLINKGERILSYIYTCELCLQIYD